MSLNALDLVAAVQARLVASCGSDVSGVYANRAPHGTEPSTGVKPYIVVMVNGEGRDTFTSNGVTRQIQVYIVGFGEDGLDPVATVWDKVYGDSNPPTAGPTYGLQRWKPTFATNNEPCVINFVSDDPLFEEDPNAFGYVLRFTIDIDYRPPTP